MLLCLCVRSVLQRYVWTVRAHVTVAAHREIQYKAAQHNGVAKVNTALDTNVISSSENA